MCWVLLAALSLGLGVVLDAWLAPVPRWTRNGDFTAHGVAPDGRGFWAIGRSRNGDHDGPVLCLDTATGVIAHRYLEHGYELSELAFSENQQVLAAVIQQVGQDTQQLWTVEPATGRQRQVAVPITAERWDVSFSPHGQLILIAARSRTKDGTSPALLFDAESLRIIATIADYAGHVGWTSDGYALFVCDAGKDGSPALRRISRDGETMATLANAGVWHAFTPDGKPLITDAIDDAQDVYSSLLVWELDAIKGVSQPPRRVAGHYSPLEVLPDGRTIVARGRTALGDSTVVICGLDDGRTLGEFPLPEDGGGSWAVEGSELFWMTVGPKLGNRIMVYRPRPAAKLWERVWPDHLLYQIECMPRANVIAALRSSWLSPDALDILDLETGAVRRTIALEETDCALDSNGSLLLLTDSSSGWAGSRHLVEQILDAIRGWLTPDTKARDASFTRIRVFDGLVGDEVLRAHVADDGAGYLAPDGNALVVIQKPFTGDGPGTILCYNLPRRVSWLRVASIAAGALLVMYCVGRPLLRWHRGRRARRSQSALSGDQV
jgi:hypothetical protein